MAGNLKKLVMAMAMLAAATGGGHRPARAAADADARPQAVDMRRIAPLPEPDAIPLYPDNAGAKAATEAEIWTIAYDHPWVRNVTRPTLTPFLPPQGQGNGGAVLILPGGGFMFNSIDNEGWGVARALAQRGYSAFVLKYRTEATSRDDHAFWDSFVVRLSLPGKRQAPPAAMKAAIVMARDDTQAALRLIRNQASQWQINPHRVGLIGFSAGAITAVNSVLADAPDARPDFFAPIYGNMKAVKPPAHPQPMFVALAADDPLFGKQGFGLVESWQRAGGPVELHFYSGGDHGFGVHHMGTTSDLWLDQFVAWMQANKL